MLIFGNPHSFAMCMNRKKETEKNLVTEFDTKHLCWFFCRRKRQKRFKMIWQQMTALNALCLHWIFKMKTKRKKTQVHLGKTERHTDQLYWANICIALNEIPNKNCFAMWLSEVRRLLASLMIQIEQEIHNFKITRGIFRLCFSVTVSFGNHYNHSFIIQNIPIEIYILDAVIHIESKFVELEEIQSGLL